MTERIAAESGGSDLGRILKPVLTIAIAVVVVASTVVHALHHAGFLGERAAKLLIGMFSLDSERGFPAWFACLLLAAIAVSCFTVAIAERDVGSRRIVTSGWTVLGVALLWVSFDEVTARHESLGVYLKNLIGDVPGIALWLIPIVPLLIVFAAIIIPLLRRLPAETRARIVTAALLFLGGAVGMESIGAVLRDLGFGPTTPLGQLEVLLEEVLEMVGAALMLVTTLHYRNSLLSA